MVAVWRQIRRAWQLIASMLTAGIDIVNMVVFANPQDECPARLCGDPPPNRHVHGNQRSRGIYWLDRPTVRLGNVPRQGLAERCLPAIRQILANMLTALFIISILHSVFEVIPLYVCIAADDVLYRVHNAGGKEAWGAAERVLRSYFQLDVSMVDLYAKWSAADKYASDWLAFRASNQEVLIPHTVDGTDAYRPSQLPRVRTSFVAWARTAASISYIGCNPKRMSVV